MNIDDRETGDEYRQALAEDLLADAEAHQAEGCDPPRLTGDGGLIITLPSGGLSG